MIHTSSSARVEGQKEVVSLTPPVQREVPPLVTSGKGKKIVVLDLPGEALKKPQETTSEAPAIPTLTTVGKSPESSIPPLQKVEPIDLGELPKLQKVEVAPKIPEVVQVTATAEEIPKLVEARYDSEPNDMIITNGVRQYRVMRKFNQDEVANEHHWTDDMDSTLGLVGQEEDVMHKGRTTLIRLIFEDDRFFIYPLTSLQEISNGESFDIKEMENKKPKAAPKLVVLDKKKESPVIKALPVSYMIFMYDWEADEVYFITTISNRDAFVESCKKEISNWVKSKAGSNGNIYGGAINAMKVPKELSELNVTKIYNLRGELEASTAGSLNSAAMEEFDAGGIIRGLTIDETPQANQLLSSWILITSPADVTFSIPMKSISEGLQEALSS